MSEKAPHITFDKAQFEKVFRMHFQHLCHFAKQYVGDLDTAQDITQKVFINLWEKREEIDPSRSIKSYLFTIVKNRCLNHIRDTAGYRSKVLDIDCGEIELGFEEEHFAAEELSKQIEAALSTLPEKCRKVFEMSRFQQMKYKEIAEELEISQKTVEAHMSKAIKSLREYLKDYLLVLLVLFEMIE